MLAREELRLNDSKKISILTFKAIYTCSSILSYEIDIFSRNIFLLVRMQNYELMKNYVRMIQTRSENQYL